MSDTTRHGSSCRVRPSSLTLISSNCVLQRPTFLRKPTTPLRTTLPVSPSRIPMLPTHTLRRSAFRLQNFRAVNLFRPTQPGRRWQSTGSSYQPPNPPQPDPPPSTQTMKHREFSKTFSRPILQAFLIALFTYQALYWTWLKLASIEETHDKDKVLKGLEGEVETLRKEGKITRDGKREG